MRFNITKMLLLIALAGLLAGMLSAALKKPQIKRPISINISPSGQKIATETLSGEIVIYDFSSGNTSIQAKSFPYDSQFLMIPIRSQIDFVGENRIIMTRNYFADENYHTDCQIWDFYYGRTLDRSELTRNVGFASYSGGRVITLNQKNNSIQIIDVEKETLQKKISNRNFDFELIDTVFEKPSINFNIRLDRDGEKLIVANQRFATYDVYRMTPDGYRELQGDVRLDIFETKNSQQIASTTIDHLDFQISETGKYLLAIQDGKITLFDETLDAVGNFGKADQSGFQFAFAPDEKKFAAFARGGEVVNVFDMVNRRSIAQIPANGDCRFVFGRTSQKLYLFPEDSDRGLEVWDVATGKLQKRMGGVDRKWPATLYGAGIVVWSIVFGWIGRSKKTRAVSQADEAEIRDLGPQEVEVISVEVVEPDRRARMPLVISWVMMFVGGAWGIGWATFLIFYRTHLLPDKPESLNAFLLAAAFWLLAVSVVAIARSAGRHFRFQRETSIAQISTFIAGDVINPIIGIVGFGLSFLKLQQFTYPGYEPRDKDAGISFEEKD